jgi:hypothetical protein
MMCKALHEDEPFHCGGNPTRILISRAETPESGAIGLVRRPPDTVSTGSGLMLESFTNS